MSNNDVPIIAQTQKQHTIAHYDLRLRMVFVGASGVGKSCLVTRFVTNEMADGSSTIGVAYVWWLVNVD